MPQDIFCAAQLPASFACRVWAVTLPRREFIMLIGGAAGRLAVLAKRPPRRGAHELDASYLPHRVRHSGGGGHYRRSGCLTCIWSRSWMIRATVAAGTHVSASPTGLSPASLVAGLSERRERVKPRRRCSKEPKPTRRCPLSEPLARTKKTVRAQPSEPPYTDPYVRWCGRGGVARLHPIPIVVLRKSNRTTFWDFCNTIGTKLT